MFRTLLSLATKPSVLGKTQTKRFSDQAFMESFARKSVQQAVLKRKEFPKKQNFVAPKKVPQPNEQNQERLEEEYVKVFGEKKGALLQTWLEMSNEEIIKECKKHGLVVTDKQNENVSALFSLLNKFEKQVQENPAVELVVVDRVFEKFGKKKQEMIDSWLEMDNAGLIEECKKNDLLVSDKHIHNIQSLFNFLKQFEQQKAAKKSGSEEEPVRSFLTQASAVQQGEDLSEDLSKSVRKSFIRRENNKTSAAFLEQGIQEQIAQNQVNKDLERIFSLKVPEKKERLQAEVKQFGPQKTLPDNFTFDKQEIIKLATKKAFTFQEATKTGSNDFFQHQTKSFHEILARIPNQGELLDRIFNTNQAELDTAFTNFNSGLPLDSYQQLTNPQKRTSLINLVLLKQAQKQLDPNEAIKDMTQKGAIMFANKNLPQLNHESRQYLSKIITEGQLQDRELLVINAAMEIANHLNLREIDHIYKSALTPLEKLYNKQNRNLAELLEIAQHLGLHKQLRSSQQEQVFNQAWDALKPRSSNQLNSIISEKSIQKLTLNEKTSLLLLYPKSLQKKFTPDALINSILDHKNTDLLSNDQILMLIDHTISSNKRAHQKNNLMSLLNKISGRRFNLDETKEIFQILTKDQFADSQILTVNFIKTICKQITSIPTVQEFRKVIDIYESIHQSNPFAFNNLQRDVTHLIAATTNLFQQEAIPLNDMIRLTTIINPSTTKPTFLFNEIIQSGHNLATEVEYKILENFIDSILARIQQNRVTFDHLQYSISTLHKQFVPYTDETFQLLRRVLQDGVKGPIAMKILADKLVCSRLFQEAQDAQTTVMQLLKWQLEDLDTRKIHNCKEILQAIENVEIFFGEKNPEFNDLTQSIIKKIMSLLQEELTKVVSPQYFNELLHINQSLLGAINRKKELIDVYKILPLSKLIRSVLEKHLGKPKSHSSLIQDVIDASSWSKLERFTGQLISHFKSNFEGDPDMQVLIEQFLLKISNSRSLHGEDLSNVFDLVDLLESQGSNIKIFDSLLMNMSSNLKTLGVNLLDARDEHFVKRNQQILENERKLKQQILARYIRIFQQDPTLFQQSKEYSLAPLSGLMAELFQSFEHADVLQCLQMLGNVHIDNYGEELIVKLYENYSQQAYMGQLHDQNPKFFFEFSKAWPQFLRNNSILHQLTKVKGTAVLVSDQSETLQILTRKNVLHPELLQVHLETFIRMKDKESVSRYLKQFISSCAYFGYTNNVNIEQITQVLRRIYKSPEEVGMDQLLDFLVMLAVSNTFYKDFDEKSKFFIDAALDLVESSFTGTSHIMADRFKDVAEQHSEGGEPLLDSFKLPFFKQIPTLPKTYNKQLVRNTPEEQVEEAAKAKEKLFGEDDEEMVSSESEEDESVDVAVAEEAKAGAVSTRKVYERKASDSQYQEDFEYLAFRNKKLVDLDKRGRHMLMYSNINQLNFVDINQRSEAKAWCILFHFRAKSLQSMLFEEFNSISQRNAVGKTKSHGLFSKLYLQLMEKTSESGFLIQMAKTCDRTGWPIDISLKSKNSSEAVYFLLQEELCYNALTQKEEPLGLQKLMVRHLQNISDYRVHFVTEGEAHSNMQGVVERLIEKMSE